MTPSRVLIIAGSDSGGGAGIQADLKTTLALGGYGMTAITALTAQNTLGVQEVMRVPEGFIRAQISSVLTDLGADCIKTGMLHSPSVIDVVATCLEEMAPTVPRVVDPVMVAQSGDRLVSEEAVERLRSRLVPGAALMTPNVPEAEALLGTRLAAQKEMEPAAQALRELGCEAVLLKGGHLAGDELVDVLATHQGCTTFRHPRIPTRCDHGTGCTLASAIAEGIGRGLPLDKAVARGRHYLQIALQQATLLGNGHGPVRHGHTVTDFDLSEPESG